MHSHFTVHSSMDRSVKDDTREPFFRLSSSSSSPALAYLGTHTEHNSQGFDFSAQDVLSGYPSSQPRRRTFSGENVSSTCHRLSGSPVYLTREIISARKDSEMDSHSSKIATAVDHTIKKYADNILRVLEGMNGRLAHLESVSQVLENSVASLKASVDGYHDEADARLKALNIHVSEMHQAVQILRDKQDIAETTAELAKLQASKAEVVCEKAMKQPVVPSQIVVSDLVPKRYSTELQVSGQLQQLSASAADVNALPQQLIRTQGGHTLQPIQQSHALYQSESSPTFQPSEKIQAMPGVFQAQAEHVQSQQFVQPQQGTFQTQPQHLQSMPSVQLQHGSFQAQQQQVYNRQSAQSQEGASQAQQQHVWAEQTLPVQQGAFQAQAHHAQPQQGIQAPQGVFQVQPQHVQMQQSAQSQRGVFQSQQQTQQYVQSEQGVIQAQSQQQAQAHQSFQAPQGPPQSQQGVVIQAQPQQAQRKQIYQPHQNNLPSQSMGPQIMAQPPHTQQTPNAHLPGQGVLPGQGSFPFTPQNESFAHAPLSQATTRHSPYSAGPSYDFSNTGSSQQHSFSSQPVPPAQLSNPYHRIPSPLQGPQPVYASQMARPAVSSATTSAGALPIAPRNVYDQPLSGQPPNHFLRREDEIVEKVASMGFSRDEAWSVIKRLADQGQIVDMKVVLDSLMNGRTQSQRGWQAR